MSVFSIAAKFGRLAKEFGFEELRLLEGSMPVEATYVALAVRLLRQRGVDAPLDGQRREVLELDPFTLSTFQAGDLLDFRQTDLAFATPDAAWHQGRE